MRLDPKTHKARNRLAELRAAAPAWDGQWASVTTRASIPGRSKPGPWLLVAPKGVPAPLASTVSRWVHAFDDPDFLLVKGGSL